MPFSALNDSVVRLCASGKHALHLRYLVEDFFDDVVMTESEEAEFSFKDGIFTDHRTDPPTRIQIEHENYLVEIHKYFSREREDLGGWGIMHGVRPLKWVHTRRAKGDSTEEILRDLKENGRLRRDKLSLLFETEKNQRAIYEAHRDSLSLYISIPFCPSICHFCCFHSVPYTKRLSEKYLAQLFEDIAFLHEKLIENGRHIDVIYLGGGTPSSLRMDQLQRLLEHIEKFFPKSTLREYTIEAGRIDTFTEDKAELMSAYSTRICINPQTFTEDVLQSVARPGAQEAGRWIEYYKSKGKLINADLIAGLPGETNASFLKSLHQLIALDPDNITVHQLSKKRGSYMREQDLGHSPAAKMTEEAYRVLEEADYHPYYLYRQKKMVSRGENIGYAKKGTECIYNIRMMEDAHEIVSVGSNSVTKMIRGEKLTRLTNLRDVRVFLSDPSRFRQHIKTFFRE